MTAVRARLRCFLFGHRHGLIRCEVCDRVREDHVDRYLAFQYEYESAGASGRERLREEWGEYAPAASLMDFVDTAVPVEGPMRGGPIERA